MLEFTLESPKRFLNDIITLAEPGTSRRALADRRVATSGAQLQRAPQAPPPRRP